MLSLAGNTQYTVKNCFFYKTKADFWKILKSFLIIFCSVQLNFIVSHVPCSKIC